MKVKIFNWANNRQAEILLNACGYRHMCYYDVNNLFELVEKLHFVGLNVMIPQASDDEQLIAVDFKHCFTQR